MLPAQDLIGFKHKTLVTADLVQLIVALSKRKCSKLEVNKVRCVSV